MRLTSLVVTCFLAAVSLGVGQTTTGDIFGTVLDATGAVVPGAQMSVLNLLTNLKHEATTTESGAFRVPLLPAGRYQVTVEKAGFARQVRGPINLALNQQAELNFTLQVSSASETISVVADAAILNTTNAEISTRFDTKRIADLPLSTNRNIMNLAASVPGVAQLSSGNTGYGSSGNQGTESGSLAYSANGMRLRSNGFLIDGQDSYYPGTGGLWQSINNPDIIAEVRMVTNQFLPEYGRTGGSVMSIITKSGTNELHGSAFWFHNDNHLNALSNTDKLIQPTPTRALYRVENQFGGSGGGPVIKNRTFVFGSLLRWTDRRLGSGTSIFGAPSEEGRRLLQDIAGSRPTVQALLENLPAGTPNGQSRPVTVGERTVNIPLSTLTGSGAQKFNDWQYSLKADHRLSEKHGLMGRYMDDSSTVTGTGQLTPTGLANVAPAKQRSATVQLASTFSPATFNEFRAAYQRWDTSTNAENPSVAERIPSIEVPELGLRGFNAATTRTGIGLGANLPQYTIMNNYQVQDSFSILRGGHSMKFGFDFRRQEQNQLFLPQIRGRLEYATLQRLVDDRATVAQINAPLTGGETITHLKYYEYFFFLQDEWRMNRRFTLTYGVRYESPGDWMKNLVELNNRIVAANNNDERYRLYPVPPRDTNNWAPRVGFNYRPPRGPGFLGVLTGDEKLVMRGGFSRTFDVAFTNIALNIFSSFPLVLAYNVPADSTATIPNALNTINSIRSGNVPAIPNPNILVRTIVSKDFRAPLAEQVSFQIQRELTSNYALTAGYVGTKGTALFQTVDGNPTAPTAGIPRTVRSDPTRGVIRERCNCTSSTYHSLQMSLEKRLSQNFTMAAHYTWSSFIDGASEIFNPSTSGEIAFPQDPYDRRSERARSTYDRPHRFTVNGVWELPWRRGRRDLAGYILSGWQLNGFLTLQSGAPFGALNGSDPGGVVLGNIVGTSIRPNLNTKLDLSHMDVRGIQAAGGAALFRGVSVANPIGNAGRNIMRANGINRLDFGIIKNTRILEGHTLQLHVNFFNATNSRDWGIPEGSITSAAFLNEGAAEVPARKIQVGLRYSF